MLNYNNPTNAWWSTEERAYAKKLNNGWVEYELEHYNKNLEWSLYIYQREYLKLVGRPVTTLKYKRPTR